MKKPGILMKSTVGGLLLCAAVLYGQNVHAIALAEGNAYYDWNTFAIMQGGVAADITFDNKYSTFQAGYTTPNNSSDFSPVKQDRNWSDSNGYTTEYRDRDNPAGGSGASYAEGTRTGLDPWTLNANVYAQDGTTDHGDIPGTTQYSGAAYSNRGAAFQYNGPDGGSLTFLLTYYVDQHIYTDNTLDQAQVVTNFDFAVGTGKYYNVDNVYFIDWLLNGHQNYTLNYTAPDPLADPPVIGDPNGDMYTGDLLADPGWVSGQFNFTISGFETGEWYFFNTKILNDSFAIVNPDPLWEPFQFTPDEEYPTPEPCTLFLLGSGLAGLGLARKRKASVIKA